VGYQISLCIRLTSCLYSFCLGTHQLWGLVFFWFLSTW
jgi:hypothetical protein